MNEYRIDYEEMLDFLLDGKSYIIKSVDITLAKQFIKDRFGFDPEIEMTSDCKYAIISL